MGFLPLYLSDTSQTSFRQKQQQIPKVAPGQLRVGSQYHSRQRSHVGSKQLQYIVQIPIWFQSCAISFDLFNKVKGLTMLPKSYNTMADLSRNQEFSRGSTINSLITLCNKSEGKSESWIKIENGVHFCQSPLAGMPGIVQNLVMAQGCLNCFALKV